MRTSSGIFHARHQEIAMAQIDRFNELLGKWKTYESGIAEPERYCQLKSDLYQVRNAGWQGNPPSKKSKSGISELLTFEMSPTK